LSKIDIPLVLLGQPKIANHKLARIADARRNPKPPDIN
jgi:hypothetical protein